MFRPLSQVPPEQITAHAIDVLEASIEDCVEFDVRTAEVLAAIEHLESRLYHVTGVEAFRKALDIPEPSARYEAACSALRLIRKQFWGRR